jgi:hypothetical protein
MLIIRHELLSLILSRLRELLRGEGEVDELSFRNDSCSIGKEI